MKITYDELMTELKKYERASHELNEDQKKALIEAREVYKIPYSKISQVFKEMYSIDILPNTLQGMYERLKR